MPIQRIQPVDPNNLTAKEKQREAVRRYRARNKELVKTRSKEYYKAHLSQIKAERRKAYEKRRANPELRKADALSSLKWRSKNREKLNKQAKDYYRTHYEERKAYRQRTSRERVAATRKWQIENLEKYKAAQSEWRKNNMHIIRKHIALRRARLMNATIGNPKEIAAWEKEWKARPTNTCEWCRMEFPTSECQSDHAEPLILGGAHNLDNLVVSCRFCNSKKRGKPLADWLDYLGRE